jgi:hypothetical protein
MTSALTLNGLQAPVLLSGEQTELIAGGRGGFDQIAAGAGGGAAIGAAFGPIGAGVGGVVGGFLGWLFG